MQPPVSVRFALADGARVSGELTAWDDDGINGTFGRRAWVELAGDDIWRLHRMLMDDERSDHWINLGRVLLLRESDGEVDDTDAPHRRAEQAFARALRIDADAQPRIDAVRADVARIREQRRAARQKLEAQRLNTGTPEARTYSADPWPALTDHQQQLNLEVVKSTASETLSRAGVDATLIETDRFLFYSQMQRSEALRWARLLDRCYESLADVLRFDADVNIFWGKAVVYVFDDYDRFRVTEADVFNHLSPRSVHGRMHPDGPRVFINTHRINDDVEFGELLCRLATYAVLHRHAAPRRLPAWANEGLALHTAHQAFDLSTVQQQHRPFALKFIRERPGDVAPLLALSYDDEHWPGPDDVGPAVGYLLVEMLIRENRHAFAQWATTVKTGDDWPKALGTAYNVPAATIVERFIGWYRVNN